MKRWIIIPLALAVGVMAMAQVSDQEGPEAEEQEVPLEAVPEHVLAAARAAVEGVELAEAEVEVVLIYELEGTVDGREVEIEVTSEGQVVEVEYEDEDDERDSDEDDEASCC